MDWTGVCLILLRTARDEGQMAVGYGRCRLCMVVLMVMRLIEIFP
jgi:hypothetical protein